MRLQEGISWLSVANTLTKTRRSATQVRKKWSENLRPVIMQRLRKTGSRPWKDIHDWQMVQALLDRDYPDRTVVSKCAGVGWQFRRPLACMQAWPAVGLHAGWRLVVVRPDCCLIPGGMESNLGCCQLHPG